MAAIIPIPGFAEPVSSLLHLIAAVVIACAGPKLVRQAKGDDFRQIGMVVFTVSCVFLLSMSGTYHLLNRNTTARDVVQVLDHVGIYCLIAGTFTAAHAVLFRGAWRWGMITMIWVIAVIMIVIKVLYFDDLSEMLGLAFYLGMGWIGVLSGIKVWRAHGFGTCQFLFAGGVAYSAGAVTEFFRTPTLWPGVFGPHEMFHVAVIVGVAFHWIFLYRFAQHLGDHPRRALATISTDDGPAARDDPPPLAG